MKVSQVMSATPVTVHPETTVRAALWLLAEHAITTMPVVDSAGRILGVVGEGDLLDADRLDAVVGPVIRRVSVVVNPETDLLEASGALQAAHLKSLPVVDAADQVVGMVSRSDVIRTLARDDGLIQQDIIDAMCAARLHGWQVAVHNGIVDLRVPADGASDVGVARRAAEQTLGVDGVRVS